MAAGPQKIQSRITDGLKKFQPIIETAKIRDVSESDTVVLKLTKWQFSYDQDSHLNCKIKVLYYLLTLTGFQTLLGFYI